MYPLFCDAVPSISIPCNQHPTIVCEMLISAPHKTDLPTRTPHIIGRYDQKCLIFLNEVQAIRKASYQLTIGSIYQSGKLLKMVLLFKPQISFEHKQEITSLVRFEKRTGT